MSRAVKIFAIAGKTSEMHTLVLPVPIVDCQQDITLVDSPCIGNGGNERAVDHVPQLPVVLLFLIDYAVNIRSALPHGERSEFRKYLWFGNIVLHTDILDLSHNLLRHVFIIVLIIKSRGERETSAYVDAVQLRADFLQLAI